MNTENKLILNFTKSDYFSKEELITILTSETTGPKTSIIVNKLKEHVLINNNQYYLLNKVRITYEPTGIYCEDNRRLKEELQSQIRQLLEGTYLNITRDESDNLKLIFGKKVNNLFSAKLTNEYITDVIKHLTRDDINFNDVNKYEIHFENGYIDLKDDLFKPRNNKKHYISKYINREFEVPSNKYFDEINKLLNQIFPNEDDKNYILMNIGACLTGDIIEEQSNLFLLGKGSTGKSTFMKLCKLSFELYVIELKSNTFTVNNPKQDKILNEFAEKQFIRISWINELEDKRVDDSLFKEFCEGLLKTTRLYQDGQQNFKHFSKLIFTSNTFPKIKIDGGTIRRIEAHEHKAEFVDSLEQVDELKHKYLKDTKLISNIEKDNNYLNAFMKIISNYSCKWLKNKKCYLPTENFKETKNKVIDINDVVGEFLDAKITITKNLKDRIGKNQMHEEFKLFNEQSRITERQLMGILQNKGIDYETQCSIKGVKGVYTCVKFKTNEEMNEIEEENNNEIKLLQIKLNEALKKNKELEEIIKKLKEEKQTPKCEEKPTEEIKPIEEIKLIEKTNKSSKKIKKEKRKSRKEYLESSESESEDDIKTKKSNISSSKNIKKNQSNKSPEYSTDTELETDEVFKKMICKPDKYKKVSSKKEEIKEVLNFDLFDI